MGLLFIEKVRTDSVAFETKVRDIASRLKIQPDWLMAVMDSETGGTFSPSIRNGAGSGATGLIQFMPATAKGMGTTTDALAVMSAVEQLDYVERYLTGVLKERGLSAYRDYDDVYFAVFYPAAIGKADDWQFPMSIYRQNLGVDMDKNGVITVGDFKQFIRRNIPAYYLPFFFNIRTQKNVLLFFWVVSAVIVITATMVYLAANNDA